MRSSQLHPDLQQYMQLLLVYLPPEHCRDDMQRTC